MIEGADTQLFMQRCDEDLELFNRSNLENQRLRTLMTRCRPGRINIFFIQRPQYLGGK